VIPPQELLLIHFTIENVNKCYMGLRCISETANMLYQIEVV
jgi:hypothetical protein